MDETGIWEEVLKYLRKEISEQEVKVWLEPLAVAELRGDLITLTAPNKFYKKWVEDKYLPQIKKVFKENLAVEADVSITVGAEKRPAQTEGNSVPSGTVVPQPKNGNNLNREYIFENFVAGSSNEFAYSACQAVSEGQFMQYNPLFIYGGVGLGKTHMMQAVGNRILEKFPKMKVLYCTSETFTNEMINAIRMKKMDEFQNKYRNIDLILFDDVQFLSGKQRSTEEFFNTFNALYDNQKQIIITSDKTPAEIPEMEDRLKSRFSWGLIADIQPPSVEEKTAILIKRAEFMGLPMPQEVAFFMAENLVTENIRELIGALVRLSAFSSFHKRKVTIDLATQALEKFLVKKDRIVTSDNIIEAVSSYFNVKLADMKSKKRTKSISMPRQVAMYLLREKLNLSLQEVGSMFGGRDHSTVLHAVNSIADKYKESREVQLIITTIERELYS
ncbi:chromosomal replication initiator protein DnaA [Seleniivibrio sp.]|uniref:chromosomal replication initiator protein DnaA n=1 Tax=Seleniivibrio sp. TaxID=2898801 RepID=UPI0025D8E44B|nr:chromosomal replication initiator protein DnaA [Seleniivibrio sp.]MCD8552591.1 chromosomal replication initiator protein DnaA [Seleniivibrio sp.]